MSDNRKVLIVDDEEKARLYLAQILHELRPDLFIHFASSPSEAVFLLESQCVDLVMLDVEMPGMTGLELLTQLQDKLRNTPVIFISAYKRAEFIQKAIRLNAIDYIDKPVNPMELESALVKAFALHGDSTQPEKLPSSSPQKLKLPTSKGIMYFEPAEILYFESNKRDSIVHFVNGCSDVLVRSNLTSLVNILPADNFLRVSRQYIINSSYIKFVSACNKTITLFDERKSVMLHKIYPEYFKRVLA